MLRLAIRTLVLFSLVAFVRAQNTTASVTIDGNGVGCQAGGALLTGGESASADITVHYDASSAVLRVVVANTTPVVAGESTAVITALYLNIPPGAITTATLIDQSGSGGAAPDFAISFDDDVLILPNANAAACLGDFNLRLAIAGPAGGIANPAATMISAPSPVIGPATFDIRLGGPGAAGIDAHSLLAGYSQGAATDNVNAAAKFEAAGPSGVASGYLGSGDVCRTGVYCVGNPVIGESVAICVTGDEGCHVCLWASEIEGPVTVGPFTIPIGLPILAVFDLGTLGINLTNKACLTVAIPNEPSLVDACLYFTNLTFPFPNAAAFSFSPAKKLEVGPPTNTSTICGYKFFDHNEDRIFNPGVDPLEVPIAGWRIELVKDGMLEEVTYTDSYGRYCFVVDRDGADYTVQEVAPGGFIGDGIPGAIWLATTARSGMVTANTAEVVGPDFGNLSFEVAVGVGRTKGFWHNQNGRALLEMCDPIWRQDLYVRNGLPVCLRTNVSTNDPNISLFIPPLPQQGSAPPVFYGLSFLAAHEALADWIIDSTLGHAGFALSSQVAASILNNSCGFMQGTIYVDRAQNGILVSFEDMVAGATALLCDPNAGETGPNSPYTELRAAMLACTNEFGSINETGDPSNPQVVFASTGAPKTFSSPY